MNDKPKDGISRKNRNNFLLEIEKSKSQIFKKGDKKAI